MTKLFYGVVVALVTAVIVLFAPAVNADPTQVSLPGNSAPFGSPEQKNLIHPQVINTVINAGAVGPNTIPNNVNANGTAYSTPGILDGTDNSR